jgi:predicted transcriptional regulator of viral defense system
MPIELQIVPSEAAQSSPRQLQQALAAKATAQHGVIARRQLLELGLTRHHVETMLDTRRLHRVHRGVYAVGHRALSTRGRWMAAVLACGLGALLSHRSCAALAGVRQTAIAYVEVIVPSRRGQIAGVRAYVSQRIEPQDRHEIDGIPCTSLARTLLDLATVLPRRGLERVCDEAAVQEIFDLRAVNDVLARSHGCRGAAKLQAVLHEHAIGTTRTRSDLEELALAVLDGFAIPRAVNNVRVFCRDGVMPEVDFLWRAQRLVLEVDGGRYHSSPRQIARDRRKEADLVRAGYRVLRASEWQLEHDPRGVALMVRAALDA